MIKEENIKTPDHIDRAGLEQKILDLFEYRMFPLLLERVERPEPEKSVFFNHLFDLQEAIYLLDAHLESFWQVDDKIRKDCWKNIVFYLKKCLPPGQLSESYLQHIEKYEKHELALRFGRFPDRFTMSYFYYYKSCDVKLLRRLIYEFSRSERKNSKLSDWRWFDYVTEINDDITDVYEDMAFYNGNRYLIELIRHGKKHTLTRFTNMLQSIRTDTEKRMNKKNTSPFQNQIHLHTLENVTLTMELLESMTSKIDLEDLKSNSVMTKYIL